MDPRIRGSDTLVLGLLRGLIYSPKNVFFYNKCAECTLYNVHTE